MKHHSIFRLSSLALALAVASAPAAQITWSVHDITDDVTNVLTDGVVVDARNGHLSNDRTVNGVTFLSVNNSGELFDSLFRRDNIGNRGYGNVVADGGYRNFLSEGQRSGRIGYTDGTATPATNEWATVNLTGLTIGNTYKFQIWASDNSGTAGDRGLLLGDGLGGDPNFSTQPMVLWEVAEGGCGQYAIGTFIADATTQDITMRKYFKLLTTVSAEKGDHFANGWQLRDLGLDTSAPTPDPMTWAVPPTPSETSVTMTATTASDATGVEYYFTCTFGGGNDSGWQASPTYTDTGLLSNTEYRYTVMARDTTPSNYTTAPSSEESATTTSPDNTPPSPATMTFDVPPTTIDLRTITMTAATATDDSGVEYYFAETSGALGGYDSGWQDSPVFTATNLDPDTEYTYTVVARDKSDAQNQNTVSAALSATTDAQGAASIIWSVYDITDDVTNISTNGTLHDARNGAATNNYTANGVLFESVADSGDLFDSRFAIDGLNASTWGNVVTDPDYQNILRYGQRSGRSQPNNWSTIEFLGLTPGNTYEVQIWVSDNRSTAMDRALLLGDGWGGAPDISSAPRVHWEVNEGGAGQYATGVFVADAPNQAFNVQTYFTLLGTPSERTSDHWANAWQIRDLGVVVGDFTPPNPDPMTWAVAPTALSESSVTMTATTATDENDVEYYFFETSGNLGGDDSGWQSSPTYVDTGLEPDTTYSYYVIARDKSTNQNETAPSTPDASVTTEIADTIPPNPDPMTFAVAPAAISSTRITMTATTASDPNGVEYYFTNLTVIDGSHDSGWQDSPTFTDIGLAPDTLYEYTVTARDKSYGQNMTFDSDTAGATTSPSATISWTAHNITDDIGNVSTNGSLVEARNGGTSPATVNGVTFETVDNSGNLFDSLFANDNIGARGFGNIVSDGSYQSFLALGQRSGRLGSGELPRIEPTEEWSTVEFTGLTIGNTYEIQIWASDVSLGFDGVVQNKALVLGDGSGVAPTQGVDTQLFYEVTDGGAGQYGIGTFTAVATSQAFYVQMYDNLNSTPQARTQDHFSNGLQIRDITGGGGGDTFASWSGSTDPEGDTSGDGVPDAVAWALGASDVNANARTILPTLDNTSDPTYLIFNFNRSNAAQADAGTTITVEYGNDLSGWTPAVDNGTTVIITETPGDPTSGVQVKLDRSLAVGGEIYARLKVVVSP